MQGRYLHHRTPLPRNDMTQSIQTATFGAGCFWCTEAFFRNIDGVVGVRSGYSGGSTENPSYKQVCSGTSEHAEVVEVTYDSDQVSYEDLLDSFFSMHDPTTLNRQGADEGTQYRSIILYHNEEQKRMAEEAKAHMDASGRFKNPIVTQILSASEFYEAEDEHQNYFEKKPTAPYSMYIRQKLKTMLSKH